MSLKLTPAQEMAVRTRGSAVLVSAAAGSGKTKVLVERLMERICDPIHPEDVDSFLLITFTKKAAAELRTRIGQALAERLAQEPDNRHLQRQLNRLYLAQISTIHSFCKTLLQEYAYELDLPADFRVAEQADCAALRQKVMERVLERRYAAIEEDAELRALVDTLGAGRDDRALPDILQTAYNSVQCHLYPDLWMERCLQMLDMRRYDSLSRTPWGALLLQELRNTAQELRQSAERALDLLAGCEALQSKYAPVLEEDAALLERYGQMTDWDTVFENRTPEYRRLPVVKNCPAPELQARVKYIRDRYKKELSRRLEDFYAPSQVIMQELSGTEAALRGLFSLIQDFSAAYRTEKMRLHVLDYGDLEHETVRLLLRPGDGAPTAIAREISRRYTEILVDEYQDTNEVQDRIFKAISRDGKNRFMVGDVKQSIYRFRLADPGIFLKKYKTYGDCQTAADGQPRRILLSENFRSGEAILDAANAVFSTCMSEQVGGLNYGEEEALKEGRPHPALPYPQVELHCICTQTGDGETPEKSRAEARFLAARIRKMLDEKMPVTQDDGLRPVTAGDIVVLLRTMTSAGAYVDALRRQGIACVCDSGSNLLEAGEIETLTALLQVLDNAHQDIPLISTMASPLFGFTAEELAQVRAGSRQGDFYDALQQAKDTLPRIGAFLQTISDLRDAAQELPLHGLLEKIHDITGLEDVYGAMADGAGRLENLRRFCQLAAGFEEGGRKSLHQFLVWLERAQAQGIPMEARGETNAVRLLSIHKSKGLEFPVVVLAGLSRRFNKEDLKEPVLLHPELGAGCNVYDEENRVRYPSVAKKAIARRIGAENLSEELRVLYVAMTRAKDMLVMTYCSNRLEAELQALVQSLPVTPACAARAVCPGDWVLLTALRRTESGELFRLGGNPEETSVSRIPWRVCVHTGQASASQSTGAPTAAAKPVPLSADRLEQALQFAYPGAGAQNVPSKVTATQLKGRELDDEVSDGQQRPAPPEVRLLRPAFLEGEKPLTAAERGTATHLAMQYLNYDRTATLGQIKSELVRLVSGEFLTQQQADAVRPEQLLAVFQGALGARIRAARKVIREFKFSLLTDAGDYYPEAAGEQLMLQGVVDCCLLNPEGITVIDFKTDRVTPGGEEQAALRYKGQLQAYSQALQRIFHLPVLERIVWLFATGTAVML